MPTHENDGESESRVRESAERLQVGQRVGRFEIHELIGRGGMGEVYKAWDPTVERWIAMKRVICDPDDEDSHRRLLEEVRAAATIEHPAVVSIHDVVEGDHEAFIIEELAAGTRLRDRLSDSYQLADFYTFADECVGALIAAAERGTVHCDLKPENIMVTDGGRPRILDFGLACRVMPKQSDVTISKDPTVSLETFKPRGGTPAYMAPEVITGDRLDSRADIFSLGVVFYEMLTSRCPFRRPTTTATLASVLGDDPPPPSSLNPSVPKDLDTLILRMLAKDPSRRQSSPQALMEDIERSKRHYEAYGLRLPIWERMARARGARVVGAALILLLSVVAVRLATKGPRSAGASTPYVMVAPFMCLPADTDLDVFAAGLLDAVQTRLSNLGGIYLVSADSKIGATIALEGSVQEHGKELRISYRIVEKSQGRTLAGGVTEGSREDLFTLQDEVTMEIAASLSETFGLDPELDANPPTTRDVLAYDLYLRGRGYLRRYETTRNIEMAIELFTNAIGRDPQFAQAHAGLASAYWRLYEESKAPKWAHEAEAASRTALDIGAYLDEVRITLGTIYHGTGRFELAEREFRAIIATGRGGDEAHLGLARAQEAMGDIDGAALSYRRAINARPDYWANWSALGQHYHCHGQIDEARECFERVIALTPNNSSAYSDLGGMLVLQREIEAAIDAFETSRGLASNYRAFANLGVLYSFEGRFADAVEMFEQALLLNDKDYRVWANLGLAYRLLPDSAAESDSAYRRAIEVAEPRLTVNPNDPQLHAALAQFYMQLDEPIRARHLVERALELSPENTTVLVDAAGVFAGLDDENRVLELLRKAIELGYPLEAIAQQPTFEDLVPHLEAADGGSAADSAGGVGS